MAYMVDAVMEVGGLPLWALKWDGYDIARRLRVFNPPSLERRVKILEKLEPMGNDAENLAPELREIVRSMHFNPERRAGSVAVKVLAREYIAPSHHMPVGHDVAAPSVGIMKARAGRNLTAKVMAGDAEGRLGVCGPHAAPFSRLYSEHRRPPISKRLEPRVNADARHAESEANH
ncbi:MAG: hypothetical protein EON59_12090 [Alphaproteobacteria bacterium]|nr:MAG: hypothetical protein EON59_12090 [Alphaproteobacteria bacterium]